LDYNIKFKDSVKKDLKKLSRDNITEILNKIENELPSVAMKQPQLHGRFKHLKKYRIGNFRVIYTIKDDILLILRIADRKDVYKKLS
jgi:mRNA interferase RelE/StbE